MKKNRLVSSAIAAGLNEVSHQPSPLVVAQYFYFDMYVKKFPKAKIVLPGADEKINNASTNYFVLIKKDKESFSSTPEISNKSLSSAGTGRYYQEYLTVLCGEGVTRYKITKGLLPPGLKLLDNGSITGVTQKKSTCHFTIEVTDQNGEKISADLAISLF